MFFHTVTLLDEEHEILTRLPANFRVSGSKIAGSIVLLAGVVVASDAFPAISQAISNGTFQSTLWSSGHLIYGPFAALLILSGLDQLLIKGSVTLEKHQVRYTYRDLLGKHDRVIETSSYVGIENRTSLEGSDEDALNYSNFAIFLTHKHRRNNLRLYKTTSKMDRDKRVAFYTQLFALPLINK